MSFSFFMWHVRDNKPSCMDFPTEQPGVRLKALHFRLLLPPKTVLVGTTPVISTMARQICVIIFSICCCRWHLTPHPIFPADFGINDPNSWNMDLSIEVLVPSNADAYMSARSRWMDVIVGDLPSTPRVTIPSNAQGSCVNEPPITIDDIHICGRDAVSQHGLMEYLHFHCLILKHLVCLLIQVIDGPSGILGQAGPLFARPADENGKLTVVTGLMEFDKDDIAGLVADGTWNGVILHEMAHVFGIGTTWTFNGLVTNDFQYLGVQGISVWKDDWGCDSSPPIETDGGTG